MSDHMHLQDARRKNIRWRILKICDTSRGITVREDLMMQVLADAELDPSPAELRREASYLEGKGLIRITTKKRVEYYEVTSDGTDIVEYEVDCPPGIGRPEKYF